MFVLSDTMQSFQKQRPTFAIILFSGESVFLIPCMLELWGPCYQLVSGIQKKC